jgi:O-methyltransferase involved in polyketide biosynthesis
MFYVPENALPGLSRTVLGACAFCAVANRNPIYRDVFYDPFAERLLAKGASMANVFSMKSTDWPVVLTLAQDNGIARRLVTSVLWRAIFMQSTAERALADGVLQIVILGSG